MVASAGDVNGDGFADVIVGFGAAWVSLYLGGATGLATTPASTITGPDDNSSADFGNSVAGAGDVNGDGFADVVVGSPGSNGPDGGVGGTGRIYVYLGSAAGLVSTPANLINGLDRLGEFGNAVESAGDVNGDGYSDVIVGAEGANNMDGRVYVYLGSATGLATSPASVLMLGSGMGTSFGSTVAGAGDVNGDGYADVVVGGNGGAVYLYV